MSVVSKKKVVIALLATALYCLSLRSRAPQRHQPAPPLLPITEQQQQQQLRLQQENLSPTTALNSECIHEYDDSLVQQQLNELETADTGAHLCNSRAHDFDTESG
ncbi:hypothetical protein TYRP_004661 [Tyrophagus putrescentiae]|nr:hypothetical protein TYRP_004661 [Tyrophagus putrescentiae]